MFGWCQACLRKAGCVQVEVSGDGLETLAFSRPRRPAVVQPATQHPEFLRRRRLVTTIALGLDIWGLVLIIVGGWLLWRRGSSVSHPIGNGMPVVLALGGAATTATGLIIGLVGFRRSFVRRRSPPRALPRLF